MQTTKYQLIPRILELARRELEEVVEDGCEDEQFDKGLNRLIDWAKHLTNRK